MTGRIHGQTAGILRRALIEARHGRRVAVVVRSGESAQHSRKLLERITRDEDADTLKRVTFVTTDARPGSMRGSVNTRILFDHAWHRGLADERMREWSEVALSCNQREIDE